MKNKKNQSIKIIRKNDKLSFQQPLSKKLVMIKKEIH